MKPSRLRAIPSVDKVLQSLGDTGLPRPIVVDVVRRELAGAARAENAFPMSDAVLARIRAGLQRRARVPHPAGHQRHRHSRAHEFRPGSARRRTSSAALSAIGSNYNNLEYSLDRRRARRARGVSRARPGGAVRRRSRDRRQQQRRRAGVDPAALLPGGGERGRDFARRAGADRRRIPDSRTFSSRAARGCARSARRTRRRSTTTPAPSPARRRSS